MKVVLYGSGVLGKKAYEYLITSQGVELSGICTDVIGDGNDSGVILAEGSYNNRKLPLFTLEEVAALAATNRIDAVVIASDNAWLSFITRRFLQKNVYSLCILPSYYEEPIYDIDDSSFEWVEIDKPRLDYIEYHISFHCNLNCKGCTHFSNLVKEPLFGDLDSFCRDMVRLRELFWGIGKIRLMGGEPVLNPQLPEFVYAARNAFPDADIRIVTNGLMIRKDHSELFKAMRESAAYFDVSMYPPTASVVSRLSDICKAENVKLTVTPPIEEFTAGMNLTGDVKSAESFGNCPARHCVYLCNGKISTCAMPQLIHIFNLRFGTEIKPGEDDVYDLYEEGLKGIDLLERLRSPMVICRNCDAGRRTFTWEPAPNPKLEDWIGRI